MFVCICVTDVVVINIQEFFLLGLGVILFGIVGALSLASLDSVPDDLVDNAAVLGALCLVTALVFIGDLLMSQPRKKDKQDEARIIEKGEIIDMRHFSLSFSK